jgi:hypothetical protein
MKRLSCPHCGHVFGWKAREVAPLAVSRVCPSCGGHFTYGIQWSMFLLLFIPMVLLATYLRQWLGTWASMPGVLLVIFLSVRLVKLPDDEIIKQAEEEKSGASSEKPEHIE